MCCYQRGIITAECSLCALVGGRGGCVCMCVGSGKMSRLVSLSSLNTLPSLHRNTTRLLHKLADIGIIREPLGRPHLNIMQRRCTHVESTRCVPREIYTNLCLRHLPHLHPLHNTKMISFCCHVPVTFYLWLPILVDIL